MLTISLILMMTRNDELFQTPSLYMTHFLCNKNIFYIIDIDIDIVVATILFVYFNMNLWCFFRSILILFHHYINTYLPGFVDYI